jgi:serine-type D-Ala-D-Ala carboxypeptidase (penicillin-binding protein 5/6)
MQARQHSRHARPTTFLVLAAVVALAWLLSAPAPSPASAAPDVGARSGILIRSDSGAVLWSKDPGVRLPMASCTKIMTALLVLEHYRDLGRYVRAPASVTDQQTVAIGLRPGDRITVRQALRALLIKSANDACVTLAVAVAGSEKAFVSRMNRRASQLGLTQTHYVNSRGKDATGHYSSARDLAMLGRYAMAHEPVFRDIVGTQSAIITWPPSHRATVTSHNRLLDYAWGRGIKTGATAKAGKVLVGAGSPGGVPLILVTMHEPTRDREEKDAVALFLWGASQ